METTTQVCPRCKRSFRVLEDEAGMHECPYCRFYPEYDEVEGE